MLSALRLQHFRCYKALNWDMPAEGALVMGGNARGKTSLLEAICFALTLHSPRVSKLDSLLMHGTQDFGISLSTDEGVRKIAWKNRKLTTWVNGSSRRDFSEYLADALPVVWLGNGDMALVIGSAEDRRHYLDFLGAQWHPTYRSALREYRKVLRSRNLLLKNPRRSSVALRSYAVLLARYGDILVGLRSQLLNLLQPYIYHYHSGISGGREEVEIRYCPSTELPLEQALEQTLSTDERLGYTTIGPHRDDFSLFISGAAAADFASEGQQRTLATALVLSQAGLLQVETGHAPTLLIDDIFGEMDPERRKAFLALLPTDSQIFITTTHLDWLGTAAPPLPVIDIESIRR